MFTVSVRSELADWQEVISAPDHVLVLVECSVVDNSDRRSAHAMYGIGAEQGKFIFMNTWGRLDLRAIDASWLRNERVVCVVVSIDLRQNGALLLPDPDAAAAHIHQRGVAQEEDGEDEDDAEEEEDELDSEEEEGTSMLPPGW